MTAHSFMSSFVVFENLEDPFECLQPNLKKVHKMDFKNRAFYAHRETPTETDRIFSTIHYLRKTFKQVSNVFVGINYHRFQWLFNIFK